MRLANSFLIFCFLSLTLPSRLSGPFRKVDAKPYLAHIGSYLSGNDALLGKVLPMLRIKRPQALLDGPSVERVIDKDWSNYYNLVEMGYLETHGNSELGLLIAHVRQVGPDIIKHHTDHEGETLSMIQMTRRVLERGDLEEKHRIWALGVLSCLKKRILTEKEGSLSKKWTIEHLISRPFGDFELFLLEDHDLGRVVQDNLKFKFSHPGISDEIIGEALNRASIVNLIKRDMDLSEKNQHQGFQKILVSFMNLKSSIDDACAKQLMERIGKMLDSIKHFLSMPLEEIFTIRMALHMEEHHFNSMIQFKELINDAEICTRILRKELEFQLQDKELSSTLKGVFKSLMNNKTPKSESIHLALEAMNDEKHYTLHRARVTRVLNLMAKHDDHVFDLVNKELDCSNSMISNLAQMFLEMSRGRMYPEKLQKNDLQYLVFQKDDKILTEERLAKLEENLLAGGFLDLNIIKDVLRESRSNSDGATGLTPTIKRLLIKLVPYWSDSTDPKLEEIRYDPIEYILHLILLEKDDIRLNRNLLMRGKEFVQEISSTLLSVAESDSISLDDRLRTFSNDLTT
ncbi:hypothetical protein DFH28DRAFT_877883 [Melampsora americana]|nr:hypothetical protein DFH28DRAFT_877883 [Melampsora americana]